MSNLEHLIENTLIYLEQNPQAPYNDVISNVKNDVNYEENYIDASDVCLICFYVRFVYLRSLLSDISSDISNAVGYAKNIKRSDLNKILAKRLLGDNE